MNLDAAQITEALFSDFQLFWAGQAAPLTFDGVKFDPEKLDVKALGFVRMAVRHLPFGLAALGNELYRRSGIVTIQCFTPSGDGAVPATTLAQEAVKFLQQGSEHVRFQNVGIQTIGDDGQSWFQVHAQADMQYDYLEGGISP